MRFINIIKLLLNIINILLEFKLINSIRIHNSAYHDIVIDIRESVPKENCKKVLHDLESALTSASHHLFTALDGRAYFKGIIINIPDTWPDNCVTENHTLLASSGESSDITITTINNLFANQIWTQQSSGCGEQGDQIYVSHTGLESNTIGKEFVREWAKYRYGIFDEIGYEEDKVYPVCYFTDKQHVTGCSDGFIENSKICQNSSRDIIKAIDKKSRTSLMFAPQADNIVMFCDEGNHNRFAPSKHNLLCKRRSTLDVILQHIDFQKQRFGDLEESVIISTVPTFHYYRRSLMRYVVVIDESQDIMLRETWSFLRNAIRKWVMYDLMPNTEVGIVLANGTTADKILEITPLGEQKHRDLVSSFFPYTPSDSRQPGCVACAIRESIDMLKNRKISYGNASNAVLIIAPGVDHATDYDEIINKANENGVRLITINFPGLLRQKPLNKLAELTRGISFTVNELKYNSEKSFLNTYFELTSCLFAISNKFYEGAKRNLPIEIHRKELLDKINDSISTKRASRIINGNFYVSQYFSQPAGFYIYTHNQEAPLIQTVRLTSPSGVVYGTRSDVRMPVKQLTLLADINETGSWTYMIERFNGNPQPHFVQVLATPISELASVVRVKAWVKRPKNGGPLIIYCEVKRGDYPVHSALVEVTITRPDIPCNMTNCRQTIKLLDTGAGDPDITKGDGIYTRYFPTMTTGVYKFDIYVDDNGNTAYSLQDKTVVQNLPCCGSSIPTKLTSQTTPFQRYVPSITVYVESEELDLETTIKSEGEFGRIGDLVCQYMENGKIRLTWTSPDMAGENAARYEIKYSMSINDIIDNFDTAAIMWNHDSPYPHSIGDTTSFIIDANLEPSLFGNPIFFAIRPYSKLSNDAKPGPISNPVRTYIPKLITETSVVTDNENANDFGIFHSNSKNETSYYPDEIDTKIKYAIPIVAAILLILILIGMYCLICSFRRRKMDRVQNSKLQIKSIASDSNLVTDTDRNGLNGTHFTLTKNSSINTSIGNYESSTQICINDDKQKIPQQSVYQFTEQPDHHTVGIPVYQENDLCKDLLSNEITKEHFTYSELIQNPYHLEILKAQQNNLNSNGIDMNITKVNLISANNTLTKKNQLPILSPFESWSASQLLHEHERRISPTDDMLIYSQYQPQQQQDQISISNCGANIERSSVNSINNISAPPVPPLPYIKTHHDNLLYSYSHSPNNYSTNSPTKQISFDNNASMQNNSSTSISCDKKRRNVTMV